MHRALNILLRSVAMLLAFAWNSLAHAELAWAQDSLTSTPTLEQTEAVGLFRFTNSSARTIRILSVHSSCGCTTAVADKQSYAPNEKGVITATFVFGERTGEQEKTITVTTDDADEPAKILTMNVTIPKLLELQPGFVRWDAKEELASKRIEIQLHPEAKLQKLEATSSNPQMEVKVEALQNGKAYALIVTPKPTIQPQMAVLRVQATDAKGNVKSFIAHARVEGRS